jgi:zeaxanthin glucosyltransferase
MGWTCSWSSRPATESLRRVSAISQAGRSWCPTRPQLELFRRAALAVTHAGLNTTLDALSTGLPMVAIPVTNEQPGIAARIAWVGSGETVMLSRVTPRRLHSLISRVLSDPSYAAAARRVRDAIQAAAGALGAADMIEQGLGLRT